MTAISATPQETSIRKAARRLVPFLALLYFISFLDRVNVGFAALTMNADIGLSDTAYGAGAGIFFIGYILFAVPANLILQRIGARRWLATIVVAWGCVSLSMAYVQSPTQFFAARFLLGVTESGFLPGVILYLSRWFPTDVRGRIIGNFFIAVPLSNVIGAPLSSWLLGHNLFGLHGWQTMFIVEALPAIVLGFLSYFWLVERPDDARWLDDAEKEAIRRRLGSDHHAAASGGTLAGLMNARVWALGFLCFLIVMGLYGFAFWGPQILSRMGGLARQEIGWATAFPYLCAALLMSAWARRSDAKQERIWHLAIPTALSAVGFFVAGQSQSLEGALFGFALATTGMYAACPVFWTLPTTFLTGTAAASGIALVNSLGNLAGYVGPMAMGWLKAETGNYAVGLNVLAASMLAASAIALALGRWGRVADSQLPLTAGASTSR